MPTLLHILTQSDDPLPAEMISRQQVQPENTVDVVDLTTSEVDYQIVVQKIFAADSIQVW